MKNDIDAILNSMFVGGKLNVSGKSKAAEDAEAFLKSINRSSEKINDSMQKQLDNLNSINETARAELEDVAKHLDEDGLSEKKTAVAGAEDGTLDINAACKKAEAVISAEIIGQDDFIKKLILSYKRPFVMGKEEGKPASTIIITGKEGTGRHSALGIVTRELHKEKVFKSGEIAVVDLGLYSTNSDGKLMIQDLFAALQSDSPVIMFENYDKCHKSLLPMVAELVLTGKIQLSTRYILQKGILVDAGTALVPNAISSLNCNGQYLVFMTTNNQGKIADTMGSAFINAVGDICMTDEFASESLTAIGKKALNELSEKTLKMLGFKLIYTDEISQLFAGKFTKNQGVNSISDFSVIVYRALSEYKLGGGAGGYDLAMFIENGQLKIKTGDTILEIKDHSKSASISALNEVKQELEEIIGLKNVKEYIFSLEEHYKVQQMRAQKGLRADGTSMHMIFTGNPGTGKTTVARLVSKYLKAIGVLSGGQLVEVTRADLVGRFVGHTAPLTNQIIESALGGVLFIDEAYSLFRGKDDSFGLEAIDTLVKGMEDNRDNLVVILAGYSKEMAEFIGANSGLASRFPNIIEFPDYSGEELLKIAHITVKNKGYFLNPQCDEPLLAYFNEKQADNSKASGNGRMVRNLIETAILNQSKRIIAEKSENLEELILMDFDFE